ncbi:hypothetical protein STEG23_016399, partial [Scotinomys teguina]
GSHRRQDNKGMRLIFMCVGWKRDSVTQQFLLLSGPHIPGVTDSSKGLFPAPGLESQYIMIMPSHKWKCYELP